MELLGDSLLRLVKYNRYRGIGLDRVREICRSILLGLDYLHQDLGIIHSDLKLENILLVSTIDPSKDPVRSGCTPILERPEGNQYVTSVINLLERNLKMKARKAKARISERRGPTVGISAQERSLEGINLRCKIVDFGNGCWFDNPLSDEIQTRQYRSPEVILCAGYSFSADMWSFACMAFELDTGDMLFTPTGGQGFSEDEIACTGLQSKDYFDRNGDLKRIRRLKNWPLDKIILEKYKFSENDARQFADFLCPLLDFTPEKRPTAEQCLQHPWFKIRETKPINESSQPSVDAIETTMNKLKFHTSSEV